MLPMNLPVITSFDAMQPQKLETSLNKSIGNNFPPVLYGFGAGLLD
jgi:hypothetical protein